MFESEHGLEPRLGRQKEIENINGHEYIVNKSNGFGVSTFLCPGDGFSTKNKSNQFQCFFFVLRDVLLCEPL